MILLKLLKMTKYLKKSVPARMDFLNITREVEDAVKESKVREGLCLVNAMHITASVFINDDEPGLHQDYDDWLERLAPHAPTSRYRHNRTGEDNGDAHLKRQVMGREAPKTAADLARRVAENGAEETVRRGGLHLAAQPVTDPTGRMLVVVATLYRPPRPLVLLEPEALWWKLLLLALVVGAFSLLLARHLSAPVGALRRATLRLSAGDLTARVGGPVDRRHDEIGQLARDFDAMAGRLENLLGSQRRLLRDVSHELRSPLSRLTVALQLARDRKGVRSEEALDRIERETGRLDDLIGQLLLLQRLEARLAGRPFSIVAINTSEKKYKVRKFVKLIDLRLQVLLDPNGEAFAAWGGEVLPTSFLLDPTGRIAHIGLGPLQWDSEEAVSVIEGMLSAAPAENPAATAAQE